MFDFKGTSRLATCQESTEQFEVTISPSLLATQALFISIHQVFWWTILTIWIVSCRTIPLSTALHQEPELPIFVLLGILGITGLVMTMRHAINGVRFEFDRANGTLQRNGRPISDLGSIARVSVEPVLSNNRMTRSPFPTVVLHRRDGDTIPLVDGSMAVRLWDKRYPKLPDSVRDELSSIATGIGEYLDVPVEL